MTVEECLTEAEGKAALVRYLASLAVMSPEVPDPAVLAGLQDVCGEVERLVRAAKGNLNVTALNIELRDRE